MLYLIDLPHGVTHTPSKMLVEETRYRERVFPLLFHKSLL